MPDNNLIPVATFDDVYQIETHDPWVGGPGGLANKQGQNLTNRTEYLKQHVDALEGDTGLADHIAAPDPHPQYVTSPELQAAIDALVAAAPGVLDTLDELAAALGDDPNFAATMTGLLALKAPLASPALTGVPTVPTAAPGTNTTQAASTAFVAAAIAAIALANASETQSGIIELATAAEAQAMTDLVRAITPHKLDQAFKGANQSLATNGYQKLPGGLILQWGQAFPADGTSALVTLPLAFPANFAAVIPADIANSTGTVQTHGYELVSNTQFKIWNTASTGLAVYWLAIGY